MLQKIITTVDLAEYLEGRLDITTSAAQAAVKLLFRVCESALADSDAGATLGIGLGRLHAVPSRRNRPGVWRPAFQPSRTFLRYLNRLQARACACERLGMVSPRMHWKNLGELLASRGMSRAMAERVAKATVTFWFDRLTMGRTSRRCGTGNLEADNAYAPAGRWSPASWTRASACNVTRAAARGAAQALARYRVQVYHVVSFPRSWPS